MCPLSLQRCSNPSKRPRRHQWRHGRHSCGRYGILMGYVTCLVAFLFPLSACESIISPATSKGTPTAVSRVSVVPPKTLHSAGVLTVASSLDYFPQASIGVQQQPVGFDVDLIKAIAQRMGLKMQLVQSEFRLLPDQLNASSVDVAISAISITDDMKKKMDFVPYLNGGESLLVEKGNPQYIQGLSDLCGKQAGVSPDTVEYDDLKLASTGCTEEKKAPITIVLIKNHSDSVAQLLAGKIVATYQDSALTDFLVNQNPTLSMAGIVTNQWREGIGVRKGDKAMLTAIQTAFQQMQEDGSYHFLIKTWGLSNEELALQKPVSQTPSGAVQDELISAFIARKHAGGCGSRLG